MKRLESSLKLDGERLDEKIQDLDVTGQGKITKDQARRHISESGYEIQELKPKTPEEICIIACDASILKKELLYNSLWASHTITVKGVFDGKPHKDVLTGRGEINYKDLKYKSGIDFGEFKPYASLDERLDSIRVLQEVDALMENTGEDDLVLFDGSLITTLEKLKTRRGYEEHKDALKNMNALLEKPCVGMVEDTHSTKIAAKPGWNLTDLLLFEIALNPNEYVKIEGDVTACYIKHAGKNLEHLGEESPPLTVRWEFNEKSIEHMEQLAGIWIREEDILHPQLYPLRIADYLTRKIKVSGILDLIACEKNLKPKHRDKRTITL